MSNEKMNKYLDDWHETKEKERIFFKACRGLTNAVRLMFPLSVKEKEGGMKDNCEWYEED